MEKKFLKHDLLGKCFYDPFTETRILYWKNFKFVLGRFLRRWRIFQPKYESFWPSWLLIKTWKAKEIFADDQFYNTLGLADVLQSFPSNRSEGCAIITYKHGIYKIPPELLNDLRLRILANWEISRICLNYIEW